MATITSRSTVSPALMGNVGDSTWCDASIPLSRRLFAASLKATRQGSDSPGSPRAPTTIICHHPGLVHTDERQAPSEKSSIANCMLAWYCGTERNRFR